MSYRPDFEAEGLVKVEDIADPVQTWAEDMQLGSHRIKNSWAERRHEGVKNGVAQAADWTGSGATKLEDMEDMTQHGDHLNQMNNIS